MATHIVPDTRGRYVLEHVLQKTEKTGQVLEFPDDLSVGAIAGDITTPRAAVKTDFGDPAAKLGKIAAFWQWIDQSDGPVVIWFARHGAKDFAMLLALCERLAERDIALVDVSNLTIHASWNGATPDVPPPRALHEVPFPVLPTLIDKPLPLDLIRRSSYAQQWRSLQADNAPFRVVRADVLQSAAAEEFDSYLIEALSNEWRWTPWVLRAAEDLACRHYRHVGLPVLLTRAAALVEQGILEVRGDLQDPWGDDECSLRNPAARPQPENHPEILHVASNPSFGGALVGALRRAGQSEAVASFQDDLSAGPISSDAPEVRTQWWANIEDWPEREECISEFWQDLATGPPLVVWFGRGTANDLNLYLALCDKMPDRIAAIGDVSTISVRYEWVDGTTIDVPSPKNIHGVPGDVLVALVPFTVRPDPAEIHANASRWRELKAENAPFRILGHAGLESHPLTHFDNIILGAASCEWQKTIRIVGMALEQCNDAFNQIGDAVLLSRVVALVESGALQAEGNPWAMRESRLRLAEGR